MQQPTATTASAGTSPMGPAGIQPAMATSSQYTTPQAAADIGLGAAQKTAETAQYGASRVAYGARYFISCILNRIRMLISRYPPLGTFIVTLTATSAIPVSTFLAFAVTSLLFLSFIAFVIVSIVEGVLLSLGGTVLMAVLAGCAGVSMVTVGLMMTLWTGLSTVRYVFSRVRYMFGGSPSYGYGARRAGLFPQPPPSGMFQGSGYQPSGYQPGYQQQQQYGQPTVGSGAQLQEGVQQAKEAIQMSAEELRQSGQAVRETA